MHSSSALSYLCTCLLIFIDMVLILRAQPLKMSLAPIVATYQ